MCFWRKKWDLNRTETINVDWTSHAGKAGLDEVFAYVTRAAREAVRWYNEAKVWKRLFARCGRVAAVVLATWGAVVPVLAEMSTETGKPPFWLRPGWATICLAVAGAILLLDRFFGFSTGWMRYSLTSIQILHLNQAFALDWQDETAHWAGGTPTTDQLFKMLDKAKLFLHQINSLILEETRAWAAEFQNALRQVDDLVKVAEAAHKPASLNVTVTNGEQTEAGWTLAVGDSAPQPRNGKTAALGNLAPGQYRIRVEGRIGGNVVTAEEAVKLLPGDVRKVELTLE